MPRGPTPAHIVEAAIKSLRDGHTHYTPSPGIPELRQAIAEHITASRGTTVRPEHAGLKALGGEHGGGVPTSGLTAADLKVPRLRNYFFSALAGTTWYMQFFVYTMGETRMGKFSFASWTLHMASIIIFSTLWGVALHEWKGSSKRTHVLITLGLAVLVLSTMIVGYGNYLKATPMD